MKKSFLVLILALAIFAVPAVCMANPSAYYTSGNWIIPPETYVTGWVTSPPPYQRDIYWSFEGVNGYPFLGPNASPLPGVSYNGSLDGPPLWNSDYVDHDSLSIGTNGWSQGAIGAEGPLTTGQATFHIDNVEIQNQFKHVYIEAVYLFSDPALIQPGFDPHSLVSLNSTGTVSPGLFTWDPIYIGDWFPGNNPGDPGGAAPIHYYFTDDGDFYYDAIYYILRADWEIRPNPQNENLVFNFAPSGDDYSILLDDLHVATECASVPLPGAAWLLGSGLIGLIGFARKFLS